MCTGVDVLVYFNLYTASDFKRADPVVPAFVRIFHHNFRKIRLVVVCPDYKMFPSVVHVLEEHHLVRLGLNRVVCRIPVLFRIFMEEILSPPPAAVEIPDFRDPRFRLPCAGRSLPRS